MITTAIHSEPIDLGRQGENLARTIEIDISAWRAEFGEGTVQLLHQRPGDSTPYPAAVEQSGDVVRWAITAADTARVGYGAAQLLFYAGDVLAKQCIYRTYVSPSLGQSAGEPPEAQQPWVERVLAEAAKVTGMTARAVELPAGAAPTAEYTDGILTLGIPLGGDVSEAQVAQAVADYLTAHPINERDPTVPDWAKAAQKPSYTASEVGAIAQTELQAAVATALAEAKASGAFDGAPGADGQDGTTPTIGDNGNWFIGDTDTGKPSRGEIGPAGADGTTGADGKSAYQFAVEGGYTGTKAEFAAKLAQEKFANPNALTFVGAVSGSYDGSEAVTVEIPSGGGGSGDGGIAETLIADFTTAEDVTQIDIPISDDLVSILNKSSEIIYEMKFLLPSSDEGTTFGKLQFGHKTSWGMVDTYIDGAQCLPTNSSAFASESYLVGRALFSRLTRHGHTIYAFMLKNTNIRTTATRAVGDQNFWSGDVFRAIGGIPIGAGSRIRIYARG